MARNPTLGPFLGLHWFGILDPAGFQPRKKNGPQWPDLAISPKCVFMKSHKIYSAAIYGNSEAGRLLMGIMVLFSKHGMGGCVQ